MAEMLTWVLPWEAARGGKVEGRGVTPLSVGQISRIRGFLSYFSSQDWTPGSKLHLKRALQQQQPCRGPAFGKMPLL